MAAASSNRGKVNFITLTRADGNGGAAEKMETNGNWARRIENDGQVTWFNYIQFPLTPGKSWNARGALSADGDIDEDLTFTVSGPDKVTVGAGTFDAIKVVGHGSYRDRSNGRAGAVEVEYWYAPQAKQVVKYLDMRSGHKKSGPQGSGEELIGYKVQ